MYLNANETPVKIPETKKATLGAYSNWDSFFGYLTGKDYEDALVSVEGRVRWNQSPSGCYFTNWGKDCYAPEEVDNILKTYLSLVLPSDTAPSQIPEYDPVKHPENTNTIINAISSSTGRSYARVLPVMDQLYWGTMTGAIKTNAILNPLTYSFNQSAAAQTPAGVNSADKAWFSSANILGNFSQPGVLGDVMTYLKWILVGGAGVAVIGGLLYVKSWLPKAKQA